MFYFKVNHLNKSTKFRDWLSSNDLFVLIKYGNQVRRTTVKWNNNSPVWNESFIFEETDEKVIYLSIYDEDAYSKSDKIQEYGVNIKNGEIRKYKTKYLEVEMGTLVPQSDYLELEKKIANYKESLDKRQEIIDNLNEKYLIVKGMMENALKILDKV